MTLALDQPPVDDLSAFTRRLHEEYAVAWLASFRSPRTIDAYRTGIGQRKHRITQRLSSLDFAGTIAEMNADARPVPGFPGYFACPDGTIVGRRGAPLKPRPSGCGRYHRVVLYVAGRGHTRYVHRLVAAAFFGPLPDGHEVNHRNGVGVDNRASNLEYVTPSENVRHAFDVLGRQAVRGERFWSSKLTEDDVRAIRAARAEGATYTALARRYGVTRNAVAMVATRRSWRHVA